MKPGAESGLPAEGVNLAEELYEDVLGKVFGVGAVANHPETEIENAAAVLFVDDAECFDITDLGGLDQFLFGVRFVHWALVVVYVIPMRSSARDVGKGTGVARIDAGGINKTKLDYM
jgi:hypothetical protein